MGWIRVKTFPEEMDIELANLDATSVGNIIKFLKNTNYKSASIIAIISAHKDRRTYETTVADILNGALEAESFIQLLNTKNCNTEAL